MTKKKGKPKVEVSKKAEPVVAVKKEPVVADNKEADDVSQVLMPETDQCVKQLDVVRCFRACRQANFQYKDRYRNGKDSVAEENQALHTKMIGICCLFVFFQRAEGHGFLFHRPLP